MNTFNSAASKEPTRDDASNGGVSALAAKAPSGFAAKLHSMLTDIDESRNGLEDIVCWAPHGRSFMILNKQSFISDIMPKYFYQLKYNSFQRQLNLYGFSKIQNHENQDKGSWYHEFFLRGMPDLCGLITRIKGKGNTGRPRAGEPEPSFYAMEPLPSSRKPKQAEKDQDLSASLITSQASVRPQVADNRADEILLGSAEQLTGRPLKPLTKLGSSASSPLSFAVSVEALIQVNTQRQKRECPSVQKSYQEMNAHYAAPGSVGHDRLSSLLARTMGVLQTQTATAPNIGPNDALEPTPIQEPTSDAGASQHFPSSLTRALLELEPTPLRPGPVVQANQLPSSLQQLPNVQSFSAEIGPLAARNKMAEAESDDESCGSDLSKLLFGAHIMEGGVLDTP